MTRFRFGELRLTILSGGRFKLDGGAMFGVVPRPLWEREQEPDERNRIPLAINSLLVEDGDRRTLIDSGPGDKLNEKERAIYAMEPRCPAELLAPAQLEPERIDRVVNTHLHFDHAGGNTAGSSAEGWRAAFPNAEYVVQSAELETARSINERTRASYRGVDYEPLIGEPGRLREVNGPERLDRHVEVRPAPGHTPGMQIVLVHSDEATLAFLADLVPTSSHVPAAWIAAYDLEPMVTLATKRRVLGQAAEEGWVVLFQHDPQMPLAVVEEQRGRFRARPWTPEAQA